MNYLIPAFCFVAGFAIGYLVGKMKNGKPKPVEPDPEPKFKTRNGPTPPPDKEHPPRP